MHFRWGRGEGKIYNILIHVQSVLRIIWNIAHKVVEDHIMKTEAI